MKTTTISRIFTVFTILFVIGLLVSGQAFAWTKSATFESGTVGAKAQGASGFDYAATRTTFSSDYAHSGKMAAKMEWVAGDEGYANDFGWLGNFTVPNGGEIWARGYYYFAAPWTWQSLGGGYKAIKILRMATDVGGFDSIMVGTDNKLLLSNEPGNVQPTLNAGLDVGRWQCLEIYVKLSPTAGIIRIWKDGVLIGEDTTHKTLAGSGNIINGVNAMSQWNQGPAQNQTQYLDEFIVTTDTPSQRDSHGNPMIGTSNGTNPGPNPVALAPPTGLRLTAN